MKNIYCIIVVSIENSKTIKYHTFLKKTLVIYIICNKCGNEDEKIFKEEESIDLLKILSSIENILLP